MTINGNVERCEFGKLKLNQKSKVVHIITTDIKKLQKIMSMGIFPGMTINLIQEFPSYVFQIGQSQFAIDKELAECIFIEFESQ